MRKQELERRVSHFEKACREAGVKLTHQRLEIFREVARADDHPDAETVYRRVRKRMPTVSLDTVYRTLWLLNDLGLLNTLGPSRGRARFDANLDQHHHFVCVLCGLTRDFASDELNGLDVQKSVREFGEFQSSHIEVRGICHGCTGKRKKERQSPFTRGGET